MSIVRSLVLYAVCLLMALVSGRSCSALTIHPSQNASYLSHDYCMVSTSVTHEQFVELTRWCDTQHEKK